MKRSPKRPNAALDQAMKGLAVTHRWVEEAAMFLTALESSVLAGDASIPPGLSRRLHNLLRSS